MVAGLLALALVAVHEHELERLGRRRRGVDQVDPHPHPLVERAAPVVPPGVEPGTVEPRAEYVGEAEGHQPVQSIPLGDRHVRHPLEGSRLPDVTVVGRHVEVADHHHRLRGRVGVGDQVVVEPAQPVQLVAVVVVVDLAPVGHVAGRHADPAARGPEDPGIRIGVVPTVGEARPHVDQPDPGDHGHAVPPALAVVGRVVAQGLEPVVGEGLVGHLRLLEAEDIGADGVHPGLYPVDPGLQGVDVPGDDAHQRRG